MYKNILLALWACGACISLDAYDRGGGFGRGDFPEQFNNRHYVDPNSYWYGVSNGYYGGVYTDGAVVIDPNAGSGAGMTDDSDQLYQSYLNDFGVTH